MPDKFYRPAVTGIFGAPAAIMQSEPAGQVRRVARIIRSVAAQDNVDEKLTDAFYGGHCCLKVV